MKDTKIVGRIHCYWRGQTGSTSSPVFEGDTHSFNANGLKKHLVDLATGQTDQGDSFKYELYVDNDLVDCTLGDLFNAAHPGVLRSKVTA